MSSTKSIEIMREGTRSVLREITASMNNSSPNITRFMTANDASFNKSSEHKVQVQFTREFIDEPVSNPSLESLSPASSSQSLATSTQSFKSTQAVFSDSLLDTSEKASNVSYINSEISGLDDLISACANIQLEEAGFKSFTEESSQENLSHYQSFSSVKDEPQNPNNLLRNGLVFDFNDQSQNLAVHKSPKRNTVVEEFTNDDNLSDTLTLSEAGLSETLSFPSILNSDHDSFLTQIICEKLEVDSANSELGKNQEQTPQALNRGDTFHVASELKSFPSLTLLASGLSDLEGPKKSLPCLQGHDTYVIPTEVENSEKDAPSEVEAESIANTTVVVEYEKQNNADSEEQNSESKEEVEKKEDEEKVEEALLDQTVLVGVEEDIGQIENPFELSGNDLRISVGDDVLISSQEELAFEEAVESLEDAFNSFKPQKQSTTLGLTDNKNLEKVELAAKAIADDIINSSIQASQDIDRFVTTTDEIFRDPKTFDIDYFLTLKDSNTQSNKRLESLYIKFDPLVSNVSMLPQGNNASANEEQNEKNTSPVMNVETPKRNRAAVDAIDRLLLFSPMTPGPGDTAKNPPEIKDSKEDSVSEITPVIDESMAKELELVRSYVLQLEEENEKLKRQITSQKEELKKQEDSHEERIKEMQNELTQKTENTNKMTIVVDEYERSISRIIAETERDRAALEKEKEKLQEDLQAANHHLSNTEAAFNDVHSKYERLKKVVSAYKSNEAVLKESIQENEETIEALKNRYDTLKSHAMAQLEKANQELDTIRKQNEAETVRLKAMVRKAELKSNSLAELVEQKTKENKELTQILDEVIARVGPESAQ